MGLYDTVLFVDRIDEVSCPRGHALRWFQTKDMADPSLRTYLVHHGRLYLAEAGGAGSDLDDDWDSARIEADEAVHEHRFELSEVRGPSRVRVYGSCKACEPVLVRLAEPDLDGDIVREHGIFVDFQLTLEPGAPLHIERISGTREDLKDELRARGVYVLEDDEPLALAHRELRKARENARRGSRPPRKCT